MIFPAYFYNGYLFFKFIYDDTIFRGASMQATLEQRKKLEFLYVLVETLVRTIRRWYVLVMFPDLVNFAGGAILCLYTPIRHPEVPAILNLCFLLVGIVILGVLFWLSYDIVLVVRGSEEVLGKLRTFGVNWRENGISDLQRLRCLKRAKAC